MTKKTLKIHYIDSSAWGSAHEMFNASLLWMCTQTAPDRVVCRSGKSSTRAMEHLLDKAGLSIQGVAKKPVSTIGVKGRCAYLPKGCENEPDRRQDELFYENKRITRLVRRQEYVPCLSAFLGENLQMGSCQSLNYGTQPQPHIRGDMRTRAVQFDHGRSRI